MTTEAATPKTLTAQDAHVRQIFNDRFFFEIHDYQRPYSWTTEQSRELLDDLLDSMRSEDGLTDSLNPYFLGSVVLIREYVAWSSTCVVRRPGPVRIHHPAPVPKRVFLRVRRERQ